jgi:nitrous oxide reductase accessory protein NosL
VNRRRLLAAGFGLSPLWAALAGCSRDEGWPPGLDPIRWDRDICARCRMVISDRRFAAAMVGGGPKQVLKFDDIGCAVFWQRDKSASSPWMLAPDTRLWVADLASRGTVPNWLDARQAQYVSRASPMGYNFAATPRPDAGSVDFLTMREHVLARGR